MIAQLPMRRLAVCTLGKMVQPEPRSSADVAAPYMRAAHVQPSGRLLDLPEQPMWFSPSELRDLSLRTGDVLVVEGGAGYGRSTTLTRDFDGWGFQNSIIRLRPLPGRADGRFLDYCLQSALDHGEVDLVVSTATIPHFTAEKVARFEVPAPSLAAQIQIADFLNHETAQIDALIAKQQQLVETLRERREAVVSQAIVGGEYPEVELRFLSAVPIEAGTDVSADPRNPREWTRYVRTTDIMSLTRLDDAKRVTVPDEVAPLADVRRDDILMTRAGSIGTTYLHESDEPACFAGYLVRWRVDPSRCEPRFMAYWSRSQHFRDQVNQGVVRSTIDNYSASKYRATRAVVPPLVEQRRIASYLDEQTGKIDALIAKAEQHIALARERRSALITAAVTGQVDVSTAGEAVHR